MFLAAIVGAVLHRSTLFWQRENVDVRCSVTSCLATLFFFGDERATPQLLHESIGVLLRGRLQ